VRLANEAGGIDNITVVLLDVEEGDADPWEIGEVGHGREPEAEPRQEPTGVPAASRSGAGDGMASGAKPPVPRATAGPTTVPRASTRRWGRIAIWTAAVVAVVVAAVVGTRMYLDRQWYVGVSGGNVAVFRGIPTTVAGFELHHVVEETSIPAGEAEQLALWQGLGDGITADDRVTAEAIVEQIRRDVASSSTSRSGTLGGGS
jgi:protein phosphatase